MPKYPDGVKNREELAEYVYNMRLSGMTLRRIGQELGGINENMVLEFLDSEIQKRAEAVHMREKKGILQQELDRLDALQEAHWTAAMMGDPKSTECVLKVMNHRAKILGLDVATQQEEKAQVLVIGGNSTQYMDSLMAARDADEKMNA